MVERCFSTLPNSTPNYPEIVHSHLLSSSRLGHNRFQFHITEVRDGVYFHEF